MRVFVYEFVTGGGFLTQAAGPPGSLLGEGAAMLQALVEDFAVLEGVRVAALRDRRMAEGLPLLPRGVDSVLVADDDEQQRAFDDFARRSDWTVVIAPECSGRLLCRCRRVEAVGGRLLGPGPSVVALASDKLATVEHLAARGVPTPEGIPIEPGRPLPDGFPYPAVIKPRWGAGSQGVRLVEDARSARPAIAEIAEPGRLERFCRGLAASVSFLCGPAGCFPLPPCRQRLSGDGRFRYEGGALPLAAPLAVRATELARRAVATLPRPQGYLGVDLVLGDDPQGRQDVVIEINPRLTTSYVGLRAAAAAECNLARQMLVAAEGHAPRLCFRPVKVEFDARGRISTWQGSRVTP